MKKTALLLITFLAISGVAMAQKGKNYIQPGIEAAIPVSSLSKEVNVGFGGSVKGMFGFSKNPQQITLEVGYNSFGLKNLPASVNATYSTIPLYAGYRAVFKGFVIESQAGVAFDNIEAAGPGGKISSNRTAFAWTVSAGYEIKNLEFSARYQRAESSQDSDALGYIGLRVGYNFSL